MIALIAISSVVNFVIFLVQTGTAKLPAVNEGYDDNTVDFYTAVEKTTYYQAEHETEQLKQAN